MLRVLFMDSASKIIDAFGGPTAFAAVIGSTQQNVTNMKARGTIPATFFRAIVDAAARRDIQGITLDVLADLAAKDWNRAKATPAPASSVAAE